MATNTELKFGYKVRDIITGLEGTIIAKTEHISRCTQWCVVPAAVAGNTKVEDAHWYDADRLEVLGAGVSAQFETPGYRAAAESHGSDQNPKDLY